MKITVFGSNGRTGLAAVESGVGRGHHMTAVVRDGSKAHGFPAGAEVAEAAVTTDANAVAAAIAGREAVIVA
ncbi:MAG: NAD(P)H-binding protein, partial [Frankiales bacterium]|nr:NAD(P)H-binding protein [Frankiales bacterium]